MLQALIIQQVKTGIAPVIYSRGKNRDKQTGPGVELFIAKYFSPIRCYDIMIRLAQGTSALGYFISTLRVSLLNS